ncbi:MAG TPA: UvrD-helicase domain-containing protein [Gemmatimonadales bacterium]|nr:UvrD-helicase domain-containing protein [Gemmatimonadales bacterium]
MHVLTATPLNPAQRRAVEHVHGPMLVLAGAGSGKTRVLTARIARLIEAEGVPAERIFAVTFTNKAAGEMRERVGRLLGRDPAGLWIGTFHALSARLLRREAERLGFTRQFTIYDEDDQQRLLRRLMDERNISTKAFPPRAVQSRISAAKNRMQPPEDLAAASTFDPLGRAAAEVYVALGPALRAANAMDFDDLLLHPLALFRDHPDRRAWWAERFAFVLADEFQDTNRAQYQLLRHLGAHGNAFAVGDDDQSIYGWRGANVGNMRDFLADFPGAETVRLEENYRSTQVVLDAANAVIAENRGRLGKTLRATRRGGEPITLLAAADERDEAEWIVGELRERAARGDWRYGEMAVLYRTNAQSRALEEAFRRGAVPYRIVGAISFYDRMEVKDLLAYLRLVANPADGEAFLRAIGVPRRGLGEASVALLADAARRWGRPLLETAAVAERVEGLRPNVRQAFQDFATFILGLRERSAGWPPAQLIEHLCEALDYESHLLKEGPEGQDRWDNVRELVAAAAEWSEEVDAGEGEGTPLERFLADAALQSAADTSAGAEEGVTLMTLHTAKGLEWRAVVLAGMEDGLFPLARAEEQEDGLEEERRLCYVGLTRAMDKLYLTWARSRRRGGELRPSRGSRFLHALPPTGLDERRTAVAADAVRWSAWGGGGWDTASRRGGPSGGPSGTGPAVAEESQDAPRFVKGERVRHRRFGAGTIQALQGVGKDLRVTVAFDDEAAGIKQLLVAYAGLEREEWEGA